MKNLSHSDDPNFTRRFWRGFWMCVLAGFVMFLTLFFMGAVNYYSRLNGW